MRKTLLLIMLIGFALPASSQIERMWVYGTKAKGPVKSVTEYRSQEYAKGGKQLVLAVTCYYDKIGRKSEELWKHDTASRSGTRYAYSYDQQGRLAEKRKYQLPDYEDGKFVYTYKRNIVTIEEYLDGKIIYTEVHKHNTAGQVVEITSFYHKKNTHKDTYTYDSVGNKTSATLDYSENFDATSSPQSIEYKYEKGNVVEMVSRFADPAIPTLRQTTVYEGSDSNENWLKSTNYLDGKVFDVLERRIEYY